MAEVKERCSCGATIEASGLPVATRELVAEWRIEHRHDLPYNGLVMAMRAANEAARLARADYADPVKKAALGVSYLEGRMDALNELAERLETIDKEAPDA